MLPGDVMVSAPAGAPPGRQAERTAAMRERLLDATVACLAERGWAGFSTNDVVSRADTSRGALTHHFPARSDLIAAASVRLVEQRVREFTDRFTALAPEERTLPAAIDILWSFYRSPTFAALLELTVGARTDPGLRSVIAEGPERLTAATLDVVRQLLPEVGSQPGAERAVRACLALMAGLALQAEVDDDANHHHDAVVADLKALSPLVVPLLSGTGASRS